MRCFLAIEPSKEVRASLGRCISDLSSRIEGIRWVPAANLHLTCKFLGEIEAAQVEELLGILRGMDLLTEIELGLSGLGAFPPSGPVRVIWAGVSGDLQGLQQLAGQLETASRQVGVAAEGRAFRAHWTLGRARRGRPVHRGGEARQFLELSGANLELPARPQPGLRLYESLTGETGVSYRIRAGL